MQIALLKWYIILFVIAILLYSFVETKRKEAKEYRKKNLIYCIVAGLCFGIITLIGFLGLRNFSLYYFISLQALLLITGILHVQLVYKILPWTSRGSFLWEFLFGFGIVFIGAVFMLLAFTTLGLTDHYYMMLGAVAWFLIPFFILQALNSYVSIPGKDLKKWYYPVDQKIDPPSDSEMEAPVVITFEFKKRYEDSEKTIFRAKAPLAMPLGRLFYYFINDYNDRHPDTPIETVDTDNDAFGWVYQHKQQWYNLSKFLDPDGTVAENKIRENSVIVCKRVNKS